MLINKEIPLFLLSQKPLISLKFLSNDMSIKTLDLLAIANFLKCSSYFLVTATAIDQIDKFNRFLLTYVFVTFNIAQRFYVNFNTNLTCLSLINIYSSAIWLEREIYDLFGVYFSNYNDSNDLRRILTDYHFKGHPLRKDFSLIGYREKVFSYLTKTIQTKLDVIF